MSMCRMHMGMVSTIVAYYAFSYNTATLANNFVFDADKLVSVSLAIICISVSVQYPFINMMLWFADSLQFIHHSLIVLLPYIYQPADLIVSRQRCLTRQR